MDDENLLIPEVEDNRDCTTTERQEVGENSASALKDTLDNFLKIGITLIVLGSLSIVLEVIITATWISYVNRDCGSPGIWCGLFALTTGALSIALRYFVNPAVVVSNLVVSLLAVVFGLTLTIINFVASLSVWRHEVSSTLVPGFACLLALAWTVLCLYHAIVVARILVQDRNIACSCCMQKSYLDYQNFTMGFVPVGTGMQNAYVAGDQVINSRTA